MTVADWRPEQPLRESTRSVSLSMAGRRSDLHSLRNSTARRLEPARDLDSLPSAAEVGEADDLDADRLATAASLTLVRDKSRTCSEGASRGSSRTFLHLHAGRSGVSKTTTAAAVG